MIEHELFQAKEETEGSAEEIGAKETQENSAKGEVNDDRTTGDLGEKNGAGEKENISEQSTYKPTEEPVKNRDIEETVAKAPELLNNEDLQLHQASNELQEEPEHASDQQQQEIKPEEYAPQQTTQQDDISIKNEVESYLAKSKEENDVCDTQPVETKPEAVLYENAPSETSEPTNLVAESAVEQPKEENKILDACPLREPKIEELVFEYAPIETSIPMNYDLEPASEQPIEKIEVPDACPLETNVTTVPVNYDAGAKESKVENKVLESNPLDGKPAEGESIDLAFFINE